MWSADSTTSVSSHQLTYTMLYNKDGIYQFTTEIRHIPFEKTCFATFRHAILCTKSHQLPTKCSHTWTTYKNAFQMLAGGMTICHMNKSFERPVTCSSLRFHRDFRCLWHPKTRRTATVRQLFGSSIDWMGRFHISTHRLTWRTHTWEQVRSLYGRWLMIIDSYGLLSRRGPASDRFWPEKDTLLGKSHAYCTVKCTSHHSSLKEW